MEAELQFNFGTDRRSVLLDQFRESCGISRQRLQGLTDEEYLWEPVPGCWSLRRRGESRGSHPQGAGEWLLDWSSPQPDPPPVTTMAWRLGHLQLMFDLRWEWTFGPRKRLNDAVEFSPSASEALERFWALTQRWQECVAGMTDEQLDVPGFGQYPHGLDPQLPFIAIVWWNNRELIQHLGEIALLRDLWAATAGAR